MKNLIIILLLFGANLSCSQIKLQGVISDSNNKPLELANVIAINESTKDLKFSVTDEKGNYKLILQSPLTKILKRKCKSN